MLLFLNSIYWRFHHFVISCCSLFSLLGPRYLYFYLVLDKNCFAYKQTASFHYLFFKRFFTPSYSLQVYGNLSYQKIFELRYFDFYYVKFLPFLHIHSTVLSFRYLFYYIFRTLLWSRSFCIFVSLLIAGTLIFVYKQICWNIHFAMRPVIYFILFIRVILAFVFAFIKFVTVHICHFNCCNYFIIILYLRDNFVSLVYNFHYYNISI